VTHRLDRLPEGASVPGRRIEHERRVAAVVVLGPLRDAVVASPEPMAAAPWQRHGIALLRPGNWPGTGPAIGFLKVPEPKTAKNSMHIDVLTGESPWDMTNGEVPAEGAESTELGDLS